MPLPKHQTRVPSSLRAAGKGIVGVLSSSLLVLALVAVSGCRVGPKYVKPVLPAFPTPPALTDTYKETDPNWHPATPEDAVLRPTWWNVFHDPALSQLEIEAAIQNQQIKAYAARFGEARAQIGINRADLRPTLGIAPGVSALRYSDTRQYFTPPVGGNSALADFSLPLTLNYEIDLFGRIRRNIDIAKEETQASAADLQNVQLTIQTELAMDYFELRADDAQRRLLASTVDDYREALRITSNRFEGGVSNEADVFQAKTQLQAAIVQLQDVSVQRATYEHAIAILIGQPPNTFSVAEAKTSYTPPFIPTGLPSELLERRPDIAAAERRTAEANQRIGIARAAYFPTLTFGGSAGLDSTSLLGDYFKASNIAFALGPQLGQTFYDGGRRRGVSDQAYAAFDESSADYRQTVLTAFQQVEDNLAALRILQVEQQQQQQATEAAQGAQNIFNNRYIGGLDTYLQVVTAQQTALTNERNDIDILRRRMDASVLLIKALGGGWTTQNLPQP